MPENPDKSRWIKINFWYWKSIEVYSMDPSLTIFPD